jgi:radical SAM superfamily enzyme YgiQ (UPF0313 family)
MHILFIYPSMAEKETYRSKLRNGKIKSWCFEPLTIATLKGLTPAFHQSTFFDDRIEDIDYNCNCDIVAISCETFTAKRSYEIALTFKEKKKTVVMGGFHPSLCPDEALQYCDSVLVGEAEYLWAKILSDIEQNCLERVYRQEERIDPKDIITDKRIFEGKSYFPFSLVETGRGCCYKCEFCAVSEFYKYCYLRRPVDKIIEEVKRSKHKRILFVDDNIVADIASAKDLFKALIPLKVKWVCQTSVVIGNDPELLELMKKSGCIGGLVGFESLNKENLVFMKKHQNLAIHKQDDIVNKIYRYKLKIYASFVIGYDADDAQAIDETLKYAINKGFFIANFYQLTPFPGTGLYERFKKEKRLISEKWWLDKDFTYGDLVFIPAKISAMEMKELCNRAKEKFYSCGSILKRGIKFRVNRGNLFSFILFFIVNFLTRKEMYKRKNRKLGRNQAI